MYTLIHTYTYTSQAAALYVTFYAIGRLVSGKYVWYTHIHMCLFILFILVPFRHYVCMYDLYVYRLMYIIYFFT